jgi:hypothetical protein
VLEYLAIAVNEPDGNFCAADIYAENWLVGMHHSTFVRSSKWLILQLAHAVHEGSAKILILSIRIMNPSCYVRLLTAQAARP